MLVREIQEDMRVAIELQADLIPKHRNWVHAVSLSEDPYNGNRTVRAMVRGPFDDSMRPIKGVTKKYAAMIIVPEESMADAAMNAEYRKKFTADFEARLFSLVRPIQTVMTAMVCISYWETNEGEPARIVI